MTPEDTTDALRAVGFRAPRAALLALLTHATKSRLGPVETCEQLVAVERRERDARNLARRTKEATLGTVTPIERFDWAHPRQIDRGLVEHLLSLDFVAHHHNVLLRGPSGVGKTMLARCLGLAALQRGHTVRFATLAAALADLLRQESFPALERRIRRYTLPDVLLLDELGYLPSDNRAADLLYNLISRRHEKRSTILTTNLSFKQWGTVFPGAACVVALVDRFAQHCHVVDIDADSWRQKHALGTNADGAPQQKRAARAK
jgi:DNA replication protein DnaC